MRKQDIEAKIRSALPDARVELRDLTGTEDHWEAVIVSESFAGRSLIERHRMVFAALAEELKGPIHALTLKTHTPAEKGG
jgi:stress-induced morphogen